MLFKLNQVALKSLSSASSCPLGASKLGPGNSSSGAEQNGLISEYKMRLLQSGCFLFCFVCNTKQNILYRCLIKMQQLFMAVHFPLICWGRIFEGALFYCIFICINIHIPQQSGHSSLPWLIFKVYIRIWPSHPLTEGKKSPGSKVFYLCSDIQPALCTYLTSPSKIFHFLALYTTSC